MKQQGRDEPAGQAEGARRGFQRVEMYAAQVERILRESGTPGLAVSAGSGTRSRFVGPHTPQQETDWLSQRPSRFNPVPALRRGTGLYPMEFDHREEGAVPLQEHRFDEYVGQKRVFEVCRAFDALRSGISTDARLGIDEVLDNLSEHADREGCRPYAAALSQAYREGALDLENARSSALDSDYLSAIAFAELGMGRTRTSREAFETGETPAPDPAASGRIDDNELELLLLLGQLKARIGQRESALAYLDAAERIGRDDPRVSFARGAVCHDWKERKEEAENALRDAAERAGSAGLFELKARASHLLANLARGRGDNAMALRNLREAQRHFVASGNVALEAQVLDTRGNIFMWQGHLTKARRLFGRTEKLKSQIGDRQGRAITIGNMARLEFFAGGHRLNRAADLFRRNLELSTELSDVRGMVISYHGLGLVLMHLGETPDAQQMFDMAEKLSLDTDNDWARFLAVAARLELSERTGRREPVSNDLETARQLASTVQVPYAPAVCDLWNSLLTTKDREGIQAAVMEIEAVYWRLAQFESRTIYEQFTALAAVRRLLKEADGDGLPACSPATTKLLHDRSKEVLFSWMLRF